MKYQPDFEFKDEEKPTKEIKLQKNNLDIDKKIQEEDINSIKKRFERKIEIEPQNIREDNRDRENRFVRRNSQSRVTPNAQQATNFQIAMNMRNRTPNRVNSLEDVYRSKKVDQKVVVPISSKFINIPTNIKNR